MTPRAFLNGQVTLWGGDCLDVLQGFEADSFDACVTDPPYHFASIVKRWSGDGPPPVEGVYRRSTTGFMGKQWDGGDITFRPETWAEVLRVLKPGAHLLAFGAPKNYHRLGVAIEDGGFEVRDCLQWLFGSGFPKSHDVSKGIDRRGPNADYIAFPDFAKHYSERRKAAGMTHAQVCELGRFYGTVNHGGTSVNWERGYALPTVAQWDIVASPLGLEEQWRTRVVREEYEREVLGFRKVHKGVAFTSDGPDELPITAPGSEAARQWEGWGTALKPAYEPIILARKPLQGTVAANVLKHGTGAINIDACRVGSDGGTKGCTAGLSNGILGDGLNGAFGVAISGLGRWPANVIHDGSDEVVETFPETESGSRTGASSATEDRIFKLHGGACDGDSGSAARFFASFPRQDEPCHSTSFANDADETLELRSEAAVSVLSHAVEASMLGLELSKRDFQAPSISVTASELRQICRLVTEAILNIEKRFLLGLPPIRLTLEDSLAAVAAVRKQTGTIWITIDLSTSFGSVDPVIFFCTATSAEAGASVSGRRLFYSAKADSSDRVGSKHPTVKPLDLMQYLVRLVTPPKGVVLDPFAGTGTTAEAAWREGFSAVLIEREAEYQADIERRMALCLAGPDERARESIKARLKDKPADHGPLFGEAAA